MLLKVSLQMTCACKMYDDDDSDSAFKNSVHVDDQSVAKDDGDSDYDSENAVNVNDQSSVAGFETGEKKGDSDSENSDTYNEGKSPDDMCLQMYDDDDSDSDSENSVR